MKLPQINKRQIALLLLALAAVMLLDSAYQVTMHVYWRRWIPASLAADSPATQPAATQSAATQAASSAPGSQPTTQPSSQPSTQPASQPASQSSSQPATQPSSRPSSQPTAGPASQPVASRPPQASSPPPPPKPHQLARAIKKRNIMAEPKPPGHGLTLAGVLDNVAFFRTRQGQDIAIQQGNSGPEGVKVTKIDGTNVTIEFQGKPDTLKLFSQSQ